MPTPFKVGCVRPASTIVEEKPEKSNGTEFTKVKEEKSMIKVGRPAPNFELAGYHEGEFKQFQLSEFKGKWVLLCFYPGDFTFV